MGKTKCQVKCMDCNKWIDSPICFGDSKSFFSSTLIGNKLHCRECDKTINCNKENIRFIEEMEDGGGFRVTYWEGGETF